MRSREGSGDQESQDIKPDPTYKRGSPPFHQAPNGEPSPRSGGDSRACFIGSVRMCEGEDMTEPAAASYV